MKIDINEINGGEILEFLNILLSENDEDMCDVSIIGPLIFESQEVTIESEYNLYFSGYFNNWGTHQLIEDNIIKISKDRVEVWLSEPFDGDGSSEIIANHLSKWFETHEFNFDREYTFDIIMKDIYEMIPQISFDDIKGINEIIKKLNTVKTYMI